MKTKLAATILLVMVLGWGCKKNDTYVVPDKEIVLSLKPGKYNPRNSEGDFITLKDGRILFVYTHFTGHLDASDAATAFLAGRYSSDSGRTWTDLDELIVRRDENSTVMSASLLRLKNGAIALFYIRKRSLSDCVPLMQISYDEARTWSEPVECITDKQGYFVLNNNRVIQLPSGRILLPVALHRTPEDSRWHQKGRLFCYYSDDNGQTWKSSMEISNPGNVVTQEPGVALLKNGNIMMLARTPMNVQYQAYSRDNGATWGPMGPSKIKSPLSPASITRIPSTDDLLLIWNNNDGTNPTIVGRRTPFNLALSKDEGQTWEPIKTIGDDPNTWYCYTAIHFVGRFVLLAHCAGNFSSGDGLTVTNITRIKLSWIYGN